jgi:hypothetical protein
MNDSYQRQLQNAFATDIYHALGFDAKIGAPRSYGYISAKQAQKAASAKVEKPKTQYTIRYTYSHLGPQFLGKDPNSRRSDLSLAALFGTVAAAMTHYNSRSSTSRRNDRDVKVVQVREVAGSEQRRVLGETEKSDVAVKYAACYEGRYFDATTGSFKNTFSVSGATLFSTQGQVILALVMAARRNKPHGEYYDTTVNIVRVAVTPATSKLEVVAEIG